MAGAGTIRCRLLWQSDIDLLHLALFSEPRIHWCFFFTDTEIKVCSAGSPKLSKVVAFMSGAAFCWEWPCCWIEAEENSVVGEHKAPLQHGQLFSMLGSVPLIQSVWLARRQIFTVCSVIIRTEESRKLPNPYYLPLIFLKTFTCDLMNFILPFVVWPLWLF